MKFEHLIQINDPANPLLEPLSRQQLWQGLMHRVEDATPFLPGLERCTIVSRQGNELLRELDFGAVVIQDRVSFVVESWVRFDILPSTSHAGGSLTISLEEPQQESLFLRFAYTTNLAEGSPSEDDAYVEYVKQAYHQSDIDTVQIIRTLAAGGPLN